MDKNQRALAAEIRSAMARREPPVTGTEIQKALGVSSTAWGTYFRQCSRDVPMSVVFGVADYLGVPAAELLRRAEEAVASGAFDAPVLPPIDPAITRGLSKRQVRKIEEAREAYDASDGHLDAAANDPPKDGTAAS